MPKSRTIRQKPIPKMLLGGKFGVPESQREFNRMFRAAQKEGFKPREARAMAALEPAFMRGFAPVFGLPRKGELEKLGNKRKRKAARKILTRRVVRWAKQADW